MAPGSKTQPPNFLFLIADQLRFDHLGCYGNPIVKTPNIDALAASGWASDGCYVASPICMPNRSTLMTGRMPSVHGVRHNGIPLSLTSTTFVDRLRLAGYRTALVGKSHLQNMAGGPATWPPHPRDRLTTEAHAPDGGRYDQEWGPSWTANPDRELDLPYYGFDAVDLTIQHGDDLQGHYRRWLKAKDPEAEKLLGPKHATPAPEFELTRHRQAWRTRIPAALHPNGYCTERSMARLDSYAASGEPFFLMCSFADPHHPYTPPEHYWDMYRPEDVALPSSFHTPGKPPPHVQWLYDQRDSGKAVKHTPQLFAATERETREALALNYGLITFIDDCVGKVVARLEALGLAENTVVVFTADHGDYMGDHQLLLKGPIHYRSITQVPLIWRDPAGVKGKRNSALAGTIDLAPTILGRAGVEGFNGIQGCDLQPLISGATETLTDAVLIEEEGQRPGLALPGRARVRTLVTRRHRLTLYDGVEWGELYDRETDPDESFNLWDDPAAASIRAAMILRLARKMVAVSETSPNPTAAA